MFCYGRVHLNAIGLAIEATCELDQLIAAAHSATAGRTIFTQSRDGTFVAERRFAGRRMPISLAATVSSRRVEVQAEPAGLLA